jgi:DHA1 family tetracycline resistance protein-like MFS transporter
VALPTVFVLYVDWRFAWTVEQAGLALAALGLCAMLVQGWLIGLLSKRLGDGRTMAAGLGCGAAGLALLGLAPEPIAFCAGLPLVALSGLAGPAALSLITRRFADQDQGRLIGGMSSLLGIGNLVAPSVFGAIFAASVDAAGGHGLGGAAFLVAAGCLIAAILLRPTGD